MKADTEQIIKYLFGELSESECGMLEDRIFSDDELGILLNSVEKDLIDDYVRGEMDSDLNYRFEQKYLISERRRQKVEIAQILQKEVLTQKESITAVAAEDQLTFWQKLEGFFRLPNLAWAGVMAAILLFAVIGGWLLRSNSKQPEIVQDKNTNLNIPLPTPSLSPEVSPTVEAPQNLNKAPGNSNRTQYSPTPKKSIPVSTPIPEKRENIPTEPNRIFAATLIPILRSDSVPTLKIPRNASSVRLKIVHDNEKLFVRYQLELRNRNGNLIYSRIIPVNEKTLVRPINLTLPNSLLKPDDYEFTLNGIGADNRAEPLKFYNFQVRKE